MDISDKHCAAAAFEGNKGTQMRQECSKNKRRKGQKREQRASKVEGSAKEAGVKGARRRSRWHERNK